MTAATLELHDVLRTFGGIRAVDGVTFTANPGEVLGVIGPNGAGKSVLLNLINGLYSLERGTITLDGRRIDRLRPDQIAQLGVGRAFQSTDQFKDFIVQDYLILGRIGRQAKSLWTTALGLPHVRRIERSEHALAIATLDRFGLADVASERLGDLPYGVQKVIDIARVIAAEPRLMLLDEPTSGTTSIERSLISDVLTAVSTTDVTLVIIDHDVSFISEISQRMVVMNLGKLIAEGTPKEVLARPDVIEAYLGL